MVFGASSEYGAAAWIVCLCGNFEKNLKPVLIKPILLHRRKPFASGIIFRTMQKPAIQAAS